MRPGRAPIVDGERMEPVRRPWHRRWPPRRGPAEIGLVAFLTVFCWGLWIHLVLPLAGLVLWWLGIERLVGEVFTVRNDDLSQTLVSYTGVFLVIAITVVVQGLTGGTVASLLGVRRPRDTGYVIVGANPVGRMLGRLCPGRFCAR